MHLLSLVQHAVLLASALLVIEFLLVLSTFARRPDLRPLWSTQIPRHLWLPLAVGIGLAYLVLRWIATGIGPDEDPGDAVRGILLVALALQFTSLALMWKVPSAR